MNLKKYYPVLFVVLLLFVITGYIGYKQSSPKPELIVGVIGKHFFQSNQTIVYKTVNWDKELDKNIDFILVSDQEKISKKETKQLLKWLEERKTVLFFGSPLNPEHAVLSLEGVVPVVPLDGNVDTVSLLYGAFYYKDEQQEGYIPLFLRSAETMKNQSAKVQEFLLLVKKEFY